MYCAECGVRLPSEAKYCLQCGHPVEPSSLTSPAPPSQRPSPPPPQSNESRVSAPPVRSPIGALNRPVLTPPVAYRHSARERSRTAGVLAIGAATLVAIGSLGPWVSGQAAFVGSFEVSGMEGDGKITLVGGLAAVVLLAFLLTSSPDSSWLGIVSAIALAICAVIGIVDWQDVSDRVASVDADTPLVARVGWGLQVVTIGGVAGAVLAVVQTILGRRR